MRFKKPLKILCYTIIIGNLYGLLLQLSFLIFQGFQNGWSTKQLWPHYNVFIIDLPYFLASSVLLLAPFHFQKQPKVKFIIQILVLTLSCGFVIRHWANTFDYLILVIPRLLGSCTLFFGSLYHLSRILFPIFNFK